MGLFQDLKFGLRMLVKSPGFAAAAVLTLALGIGVNSTIFTLVNGVFFKGLPFENPAEIVLVSSVNPTRGGRGPVSYRDFVDFREQSRSFKGLGAFTNLPADLSDEQSAAERVTGASITANTFSLLGQKPVYGRDFTSDDDQPGATPVALLSYGLWQSRYAGQVGVLGRTIKVNLQPYTIVGILPDGEGFPNGARLWIPLIQDQSREKRDQRNIEVFGRLGTDVPIAQATAELNTIANGLAQTFPDTNNDTEAVAYPFTERGTGGPIRTVFFAMQGAVGFVLLIACANVANLLLSRAVRRTRETSIRTALGASRWRIIRQLLIESLMLSFLGGILGLAMAVIGVSLFWNAVADTGPPYWLNFAMDYRVFAFFLAVCIGTGILFGLAPALQISRTNVNQNLREGGRGSSVGARARRLTAVLIVGEIALTIVLLVGAGLMIRSFLNMQRIDLGVETENMLTAGITLREAKYPQPTDRLAFQERLLERLRVFPGLEGLTVASHTPAGGAMGGPLRLADREIADSNNQPPSVSRLVIVPGYFHALGLNMIHGRDFNAIDGGLGAEAVIVNEPFVSTYWPGENPIGRRIRLGEEPDAPWHNVIGVSPSVLQQGTNNVLSARPLVYVPFRQASPAGFSVIIRSSMPPETLTTALRNELRALDPDLPLFNIRTMAESMRQRNWPYQVFGSLFTIFAGIALLMSAVGLYGVTAYGVGQRTQEIGIRMALGASQRDVLWLVLRQGLVRIVIGLTIGLLAAWGVSRVLGSLLVDVTATDPITFVLISALLALVTTVACVIPARRAMRLDPGDALRME